MRTALLVLVSLVSVELPSAAKGSSHFESMYSRAIDLCIEFKLPNSMSRPSGFDTSKRLEEVQVQRQALAVQFASPAGLSYIEGRITPGGDELENICAKELLGAASSVGR